MVKLLYVGNLLSKHGNTPGVIETLGKKLEEDLDIDIIYAGYKLNKIERFFEMVLKTIRYGPKVDYVLIDTYSTSAFWFAFSVGMICRALNVKYIPILHGGDLPNRLNRSRMFCKLLFGGSYQNIAVSNYLHQAFKQHNYKSIIIPNSIDISGYTFLMRPNINGRLLWVRSFHRDYNPIMAIDVLEILSKSNPNICLCMVGPDKDGSMQEVQKYAKDKSVLDKVKITGRLSKPEWHKLSEEYDVFINTTNYDNTPVSVIEAMSLGIPVVSTNVGGIPFLVSANEEALLCEPRNPNGMAEKVQSLIDSSILSNSLTIAARKKAESFDWNHVKNKWKVLFGL